MQTYETQHKEVKGQGTANTIGMPPNTTLPSASLSGDWVRDVIADSDESAPILQPTTGFEEKGRRNAAGSTDDWYHCIAVQQLNLANSPIISDKSRNACFLSDCSVVSTGVLSENRAISTSASGRADPDDKRGRLQFSGQLFRSCLISAKT